MISRLSERKKEILRMLTEDSNLSVSNISEILKVSEVTIRSDLSSLADEGFIVRTRGGAFPAFHPDIMERLKSNSDVKTKIAKKAASMVNDGDNIMILAGTTNALIPKYLLGKRDIHIVTNSTLILPYARVNPSLQTTFVGGEFKPSAEALVGSLAIQLLDNFHVKTAFIGTDGFTMEKGVTATLIDTAEIGKKMSSQAQKTVLLADSGKYGRSGFAHILPMNEVDVVISDSNLDTKTQQQLKKTGISVVTI